MATVYSFAAEGTGGTEEPGESRGKRERILLCHHWYFIKMHAFSKSVLLCLSLPLRSERPGKPVVFIMINAVAVIQPRSAIPHKENRPEPCPGRFTSILYTKGVSDPANLRFA
jgi:hypothetical protein